MTDLHEFENDLRAMLAGVESSLTVPHDLAGRLVSRAAARRGTMHRVEVRTRRWLPPMLATAAVVALVVGGAALTSALRADRHAPPATRVPTLTSVPAPTTTASPTQTRPLPPAPVPTRRRSTTPPARSSAHPSESTGPTLPTGFRAADVHFTDVMHGWAIGNVTCSATSAFCATVARTTDGGRSWQARPAPPGLTPVDDEGDPHGNSCGNHESGTVHGPCVDHIAFADRTGYLWSLHSLYVTTDGGATWRNQHARAAELIFSGGRALAVVPADQHCFGACPARVEVADVATGNWHAVRPGGVTTWDQYGSDLVAGGSFVYFVGNPGGGAAEQIMRSADGGTTWTQLPSDPCPSNQVPALAEVSGAPGGALAAHCGDLTNSTVRVLTPGASAFKSAQATPRTSYSPDRSGIPQLRVVALSADKLRCFVLPQGANPIWTTWASSDGGVSWHRSGSHQPWTAISASDGYSLDSGGAGVSITNDGGATWTQRPFTQ